MRFESSSSSAGEPYLLMQRRKCSLRLKIVVAMQGHMLHSRNGTKASLVERWEAHFNLSLSFLCKYSVD